MRLRPVLASLSAARSPNAMRAAPRRSLVTLSLLAALQLSACASSPPPPAPAERAWTLPSGLDDAVSDRWLRRASPTYARMVREILARPEVGALRFVDDPQVAEAAALFVDDHVQIQLNPGLEGPRRVSLIAFEVANAYRNREHQAIDRAVDAGLITTAAEFGLAHEIYEYEALRLHRHVLIEVERRTRKLPPSMFMTTPPPASAHESELPGLLRYLQAQRASGHTAHYERWFERRKR